jgi:hypothetical protein
MTQFINFDVGKSYNRRIEASIVSVGCGRYSSHGAPYRSSFLQNGANLGTYLRSGDCLYDW